MWDNIFQYFVILHGIQIVLTNNTAIVSGMIIKEVCVLHDIEELERYLEELDPPEVPISNTATYPDIGVKLDQVLTVKEIELFPLGSLPVDGKRLRLLYDLLVRPEDEKLKSKLLIFYQILILANRHLRKLNNQSNYSNIKIEGTNLKKIEAATTGYTSGTRSTPNYSEDGKINFSEPEEEEEEERQFSTSESLNITTIRQRLERSTNDQNYGYTDSLSAKNDKEDVSGSSPWTEATVNIDEFSETVSKSTDFEDQSLNQDSKNEEELSPDIIKKGIPQLEELDKIFQEGEVVDEIEESLEEVNKKKNFDFEEVKNSESNLKGILTDPDSKLSNQSVIDGMKNIPRSKDFEDNDSIIVEDYGARHSDNKSEEMGFENPKTDQHITSETINEIKSSRFTEGMIITTEEIKPDVRNDDLERITTLSESFTGTSSLLSEIDQKRGGKDSYSFTPDSFPKENTNIYNYEKGLNYSVDKIDTPNYSSEKNYSVISTSTSATEFDFSTTKRKEEGEFFGGSLFTQGIIPFTKSWESTSEIGTTRKTLILKIAESFSNIPRPVDVVLIKNLDRESGNHISRVRNFENGRDSSSVGSDGSFYDSNKYFVGQETPGTIIGRKSSDFGIFRKSPASGRHAKRGGMNTDIQKLYRWFYRGGENAEKIAVGGSIGAEIKCKRGN